MSTDDSGVFRIPRCVECGGAVEVERRMFANPVCCECLPPPALLPAVREPLRTCIECGARHRVFGAGPGDYTCLACQGAEPYAVVDLRLAPPQPCEEIVLDLPGDDG